MLCEAFPLPDHEHDGDVAEYVRICPAGHWRRGHACDSCAGNGAVLCNECPGERPAILIPAETWRQILASQEDEHELVAEGDGPLLDPDCRDGKCASCVGAPCEHECHRT